MSIKYFLLPITLLLSGCVVSLQDYELPAGSDESANISFEINAEPTLGYTAQFHFFERGEEMPCYGKLQVLAKVNKGNPLGGKTTNMKNILVPAGKEIGIRSVFGPANAFGQSSCWYNNKVSLQPNGNYLLSVNWERGNSCDVNLFDISGKDRVEIDIQQERKRC